MKYFCLECRQKGRIVAMKKEKCPVCSCKTAVVLMGGRSRADEYALWLENEPEEVPVQ